MKEFRLADNFSNHKQCQITSVLSAPFCPKTCKSLYMMMPEQRHLFIKSRLTKVALNYFFCYKRSSFQYLSQLMRLWHFPSSVNSFFKRDRAAIQWARYLILGRILRLFPYFMYANSEGSGETARMRRLA